MSDDTIVEGDLFVGESTYIKGKWVRERDYLSLQNLCESQAEQIRRFHEEIQLLRKTLREAQPPVVARVVQRDKGIDYVKSVITSHWTPAGIHVTIGP